MSNWGLGLLFLTFLAGSVILATSIQASSHEGKHSFSSATGNNLLSSGSRQVNNGGLYACEGTRRRKDIRDMSRAEVSRFQRAVLLMVNDKDANGVSEWDRLVDIHGRFAREAHGGCYFLPWHRIFLLRMENSLRRYVPGVVLPFWDWSRDNTDAARSTVWSAANVGGATRRFRLIKDGPFRNLAVRFPSPHTVRRNFDSGQSGSMTNGELNNGRGIRSWTTLQNALNANEWIDFALGTENAHNYVHLEVGGDMARVPSSPNDPVFYLHHSFIDYLYELRQKARGREEFGGVHEGVHGPGGQCQKDYMFGAFNLPASFAFGVECVQYMPTQTAGVNGGVTLPQLFFDSDSDFEARRKPVTADICADPNLLRNFGMTRSSCARGRRALQKR